jgi:hypothetical protein
MPPPPVLRPTASKSSLASGYPIANISQTNAITYCSGVTLNGNAVHLQNNNEWMTIARNAEAQAGNWSLGSVGNGYLYAGHNDAPALAVVASHDRYRQQRLRLHRYRRYH